MKRAYRKLARKYHPDVSKGSDASDFFESLFGHGFGSAQVGCGQAGFHARGQDQHARVLIDLEDACRGTTRGITLQSPALDSSGHVTTRQRTLNGKISKGIKQGQRIRLSGQGSLGLGEGQAGDLYLEIEFNPHGLYRVEGHDVYLDLPITPWEAALGASVKVPTPDGPVDLKISEGTTSGRKLRLKGRGIPGKPPGDLYVAPQITVPPADNDTAKDFYRKMAQELVYNPRRKMGV